MTALSRWMIWNWGQRGRAAAVDARRDDQC